MLGLEDRCTVLESQPESGAIPKDYILKAMGYRFLVHKHYLIFYPTSEQEDSNLSNPQIAGGEMNC